MTLGVPSALWALAGIILAFPVALFVMGRMRASKRFRTAATFAAVLLSSFGFYAPPDRGAIEETESETKRKKDDQSGDPPTPDAAAQPDGDSEV